MAASPSPLPIPAAAPATNPLAQSLIALSRAVPNIDPEVGAAIAQTSPDPTTAVNTAQAAQGYTTAVNTANWLKQQSTTNQISAWNQLNSDEQALVKGTGYKVPHPGQSFLGSITHSIGQGFHDVLNAAGSPLRAVQHIERTAFAFANPSANTPQGGSWGALGSSILHPSEWAHYWNVTSNGEHYILPQVQAQVQRQYGDQIYNMAMRLATGATAQDIIQGAAASNQQQVAQQILSDPQLKNAVDDLNVGHVSTGRMLAYQVLGMHAKSGLGTALSGATDAILDWYSDPMVVGPKAAMAGRAGYYLIRNADDVQTAYKAIPGVQEYFQKVADHVSANDYSGLHDMNPKLDPLFDALRAWHPTTADEVAGFFSDEANVNALIAGHPASIPGVVEAGIIPHLSYAGQLRLQLKGVLQNSIDWAADRPATIEGLQPGDTIDHAITAQGLGPVTRITTASGQFLRKLLTLTPTGIQFNANDPAWFGKLHDLALAALPRARANQLLNDYAASATLAGRRNIYAGMLREISAAMGIDRIPEVSDWADAVLNPDSDLSAISHQKYAPGMIDQVTREGNQARDGILESDLTDMWAMPNFKELYAQSKKLGIERAVNGAINNRMVDRFMNEAWKPMALARFGFALRVAGEEAFGLMLRANPTALLHARAAGTMVRQQALADNPDLEGHIAGTWNALTAHLPSVVRDRIQTPADLVAEHLGDATSRAMANVAGRLAGEKYRNAARMMADNGILDPDGAFGRYVSAGHEHGGNFYDVGGRDMKATVWNHGKWVQARLSPTGAYQEYANTAQPFTNFWYKRLHDVANSGWGRTALEARNLPASERLQTVAQKLQDSPQTWARARRSLVTTDGTYVGDGATADEAARDHAKAIIDLVDSLTKNQEGEEVPGLVDHLLTNRKPPTAAALDLIPETARPAAVTGPEYIPVDNRLTGMWQGGINRMFSIISKQIDWVSRQPMFIHNFAVSLDAYKSMSETWRAMGLSDEDVNKNLTLAATNRALKMTLPYIHNPEIRSQFEVVGRNVAPFMFAQEQFYKRWARTLAYAPWSFRQAQLINQGVYHSGFTHTDPATGQQYFIYPGAGVVQDTIARSLGAFGFKAFLPIEANLRGQVNMVSPGLSRVGLPSLGPAVVVPTKFLTGIFPELRGPATAIEGQQTATASYISSLVPSTVSRIWQDFTSSPNNSEQFASAMMQAIQYLEASGHGIGTVAVNNLGTYDQIGHPPALPNLVPGDYVTDQSGTKWIVQADGQWRRNDPAALASYMQRVKNWTRVFLITRTIFGFNVPASPEAQFNPNNVNEDWQTLLKTLPYNEAVLAFMKIHPDASAYTVFQTKDEAGAPLPATASANQFMDANSAFFDAHPLAGAFFIPTQDSTGAYDKQAYQNQLIEHLRVRRTPQEFWQEILYQNASTPYFNGENAKNQMLNSSGNKNLINEEWTAQSQQFMDANPLFAQQLSQDGATYTRSDIETDLGNALNDPRLPETPQTEDIRTLYNAWVLYQAMTAPYAAPGGGTMPSAQRYQMELTFAQEAQNFLATHPDAQPVFDRLMRPDLSSALTQLAGTNTL